MTRRLIDDEVADAPAREASRAPPPREEAALILGLQRGAGNAAVSRLLQRNGTDAPAPEALPALGGIGSARLRSFATGMPEEEAMLDLMPGGMAAMLGEARQREEDWDEDEEEDAAAWELPPIADEPPAVEPEQAAAQSEPPSEAAAEPEPLPQLGELGGAGLRSFATGMPQEEAQAERARELAARGVLPRPEPTTELGGRKPLGERRTRKLETAVGHHAAHVGPGAADPAALAAGLQQSRRAEQNRIEAKQLEKQQQRDEGARQKKQHAGVKQKPEVDPEYVKKARLKEEETHQKLVVRDQLEIAYGPVRAEANALKAQIDALPAHVTQMLPLSAATSVQRLATAEPTAQLDGPRATLKKAADDVAKARQDEAAYGLLRTKAQQILDSIDGALPAFKDRLSPASRATALKYAKGPPQPAKQTQAIHLELNKANQDLEDRAHDWELAKRSRDKLAELKTRRAALAFTDAAADAAIVGADRDNGADDFWSLQESVKPVDAAVKRLSALEDDFQTLNSRLAYTRNRLGAALDAGHDTTLSNGFANRAAAGDPTHLLSQLDNLMRTVEKPAADDAFNSPRRAGNYATATAALGPLENAGVIRFGNFNSAYVTSWDGDGYSVEFSVDGLSDIVIHVHCTKEGNPKGGENASHWKPKSGKFTPGVSHPISAAVRDKLIDRSLLKPKKEMKMLL